ncbi:hypothetical protein SBA5_350012 [Candidatus Sulfotelmatomonas gaucii]|uniref:Uncharacterized protein n=1 Tax=Candidatus Sulfuritelmatomonas gaucii TaxID=2043161 RepID=A0A2N9LHW4_9BACT|nr:hypothetical protein SBA5_350012 [Candidatus Sulfotelmatomonas gaucii]
MAEPTPVALPVTVTVWAPTADPHFVTASVAESARGASMNLAARREEFPLTKTRQASNAPPEPIN